MYSMLNKAEDEIFQWGESLVLVNKSAQYLKRVPLKFILNWLKLIDLFYNRTNAFVEEPLPDAFSALQVDLYPMVYCFYFVDYSHTRINMRLWYG